VLHRLKARQRSAQQPRLQHSTEGEVGNFGTKRFTDLLGRGTMQELEKRKRVSAETCVTVTFAVKPLNQLKTHGSRKRMSNRI